MAEDISMENVDSADAQKFEVKLVENMPPSCVHCRRKKARCDREKPICGGCRKGQQDCTYDKVIRTPLTRKHLTAVEDELFKTKALLRKYREQSAAESREPTQSQSDSSSENCVHPSSSISDASMVSLHALKNVQIEKPNAVPSVSLSQSVTYDASARRTPASTSTNLLETPPAGEYDWDERTHGSGKSRFADGMASLADGFTRSGYLGVASGAALVRLADDGLDPCNDVEPVGHDSSGHSTPPLYATIYPASQLEPFVDSYFATYHVPYPIVHEATFRAQFMEVVPRPRGSSWQVLLHIIATLGCFAASEVPPEADVALFEATKQRMSIDLLETGNLTLVQALVLMSNYIQKRNRPNSGYSYLGLAKRMAWGLALHKEFPTWQSKPLVLEMRRRVWWGIYNFDVGAIITFSRPLDMPQHGIEVNLPLNVSDSEVTVSSTKCPLEAQTTTLYTYMRCQAAFHLATTGIYERLISTSVSAEDMLNLDDQHLSKWLNSIPAYYQEGQFQQPKFRLCHAMLQWRWRNFRILMYRPYLIRHFVSRPADDVPAMDASQLEIFEAAAIEKCLTTACESVTLIARYWTKEKQNVLTCWYALYFLFQAVLIPAVCLRNRTRSEQATFWRDTIVLALDAMAGMAQLNPAATRCHATITKLCGPYLSGESPTHESPQTQLNSLYSLMFGPMTDNHFDGMYDFSLQDPNQWDFMSQLGVP